MSSADNGCADHTILAIRETYNKNGRGSMVKRLSDMPEVEASHLRRIECPTYEDTPLLAGKPLDQRRVSRSSRRRACIGAVTGRSGRATAAIASFPPKRRPTSW